MQRMPPRRSGEGRRSAFGKVADAVLGRSGRIGPRKRPRTLRPASLVALGAVAIGALRGWTPEAVPGHGARLESIVPSARLPIEVNGQVEKWMQRFMTDQKDQFQLFLGREGAYEGMIRGKLQERSMPEDLLYLAMIESGFSPRARSSADASGMWQFMDGTARQYGLRMDEYVDERRDPVKATDAALDYLDTLHDRYGSWYLAAAAYNAGPSRVDRALARRRPWRTVGDEDTYWDIIDHLPRETREYVPKILAATTLAKQAQRYGFAVSATAPYEFDRVWVPGGTSLAAVARKLGLPSLRMRELNPHLLLGVTPPGSSFPVRVPKGSSDALIAHMGGRPPSQVAE